MERSLVRCSAISAASRCTAVESTPTSVTPPPARSLTIPAWTSPSRVRTIVVLYPTAIVAEGAEANDELSRALNNCHAPDCAQSAAVKASWRTVSQPQDRFPAECNVDKDSSSHM